MGYFWPDVPNARARRPEAVEIELRAQIEATLAAGVDVTHLDAHMGTAMCPEFVDIYVQLGLDYNAADLAGEGLQYLQSAQLFRADVERQIRCGARARQGVGLCRYLISCRRRCGTARRTRKPPTARCSARLPEGLTFLSLHFNAPGDFEVVEPSHAYIRTDEYALFKSGKIKQWADEIGLEVVGMRAMREDLRSRLAA